MKTDIKWGHATVEDFFYWINERHQIYINRWEKNLPKPWTEDPIFQQYKFTNVFRQLDRVTKEYTRLVNNPTMRKDPHLLMLDTILFRMFNLPETYVELRCIMPPGTWDAQ